MEFTHCGFAVALCSMVCFFSSLEFDFAKRRQELRIPNIEIEL